jgi:beta-alanine degradation protein BauB
MEQAQSSILVETDRVRVTAWTFAPDQATGMHRHELDYVVVPVSGGTFTVTAPDGATSLLQQERGQAYARPAGVQHDVASAGQSMFVEVELKP